MQEELHCQVFAAPTNNTGCLEFFFKGLGVRGFRVFQGLGV